MKRVVKYKTHYKTMQELKAIRRDRDNWIESYESLYKLASNMLSCIKNSEKHIQYSFELSLYHPIDTSSMKDIMLHPELSSFPMLKEEGK